MSEQRIDASTLVSRIDRLEDRQNLLQKNITWLKRYFDELTQEFNSGDEPKRLENLQQTVLELSKQVIELQQRLNNSHIPDAIANHNSIVKVDQQKYTATFSDEEFKILRISHLLESYHLSQVKVRR